MQYIYKYLFPHTMWDAVYPQNAYTPTFCNMHCIPKYLSRTPCSMQYIHKYLFPHIL